MWVEETIAFMVGWPGTVMPYSVSMPMTRWTLTGSGHRATRAVTGHRY
jgi:hypothetical protein